MRQKNFEFFFLGPDGGTSFEETSLDMWCHSIRGDSNYPRNVNHQMALPGDVDHCGHPAHPKGMHGSILCFWVMSLSWQDPFSRL